MWPCAKPRPAALCSRLATYRLNVIMFDQHTAALHIRVNHVLSIQIHSLCILVNILFHIIILQKKKKTTFNQWNPAGICSELHSFCAWFVMKVVAYWCECVFFLFFWIFPSFLCSYESNIPFICVMLVRSSPWVMHFTSKKHCNWVWKFHTCSYELFALLFMQISMTNMNKLHNRLLKNNG